MGNGNTNNIATPHLLLKDPNIKDIYLGWYHTMIYKSNGEMWVCGGSEFFFFNSNQLIKFHCSNFDGKLGVGHNKDQLNLVLMTTDNTIVSVNGESTSSRKWSPEIHKHFPESFKQGSLTFVFCLKQIYAEKSIKLPKYMIFEILKKVDHFGEAPKGTREKKACSIF